MRVLTWNIHGARDASTEVIAKEILRLVPDVVCLNEFPRKHSSVFSDSLRMRAFVASSRVGPYGNAIFTSLPVRSTSLFRFPGTKRIDRRDAAVVDLGNGLRVAAVHLNLWAPKRLTDLEALFASVGGRVIICGDMNEGPGGAVWRALGERYQDANRENPAPTFPASFPRQRIDSVWVPHTAQVMRCEVIQTTSSDHCAVVVDVEP